MTEVYTTRNRSIKSRAKGSSLQLTDCLSSLLALELLSPGPELYLISPWISEIRLLDDRFSQYRGVLSDSNREVLPLGTIFAILAERGTQVRIICRPNHPQTEGFLRKLPPEVECRHAQTLHEKGLISHRFYLRGSMNFTYSGVNLNDESVELTTDPAQVALAVVEVRKRWEDAEPWR